MAPLGSRSAHFGALPGHLEFDRAPDFDVLDAFGAAHQVKLEGLLGALVEAVGNVAGGGLIGFELYVVHGSPYPSSRLRRFSITEAVPAEDVAEALARAPEDLIELQVFQFQRLSNRGPRLFMEVIPCQH